MPVLTDGGRLLSYGGALRRLAELGGEPVVGVVTRGERGDADATMIGWLGPVRADPEGAHMLLIEDPQGAQMGSFLLPREGLRRAEWHREDRRVAFIYEAHEIVFRPASRVRGVEVKEPA
jgi:hypothetical protein